MNDPNEPLWGSWAGRYGLNESFPGKPYYWANQADAWNGVDRVATIRWLDGRRICRTISVRDSTGA